MLTMSVMLNSGRYLATCRVYKVDFEVMMGFCENPQKLDGRFVPSGQCLDSRCELAPEALAGPATQGRCRPDTVHKQIHWSSRSQISPPLQVKDHTKMKGTARFEIFLCTGGMLVFCMRK